MIEGAIKSILVGDSAIQAIISGRAYPVHGVQEPTFPFVTYQRISTNRELLHSGASHVAEAVFQITAWGNKPLDSDALATAIIAKFHGLKATVGSDQIVLANVVNQTELYDEDASTYYVAVDVAISYRE